MTILKEEIFFSKKKNEIDTWVRFHQHMGAAYCIIGIYWQTVFGKRHLDLANGIQICQNSAQIFGEIQKFHNW
jgi:hypothetical protein